MHIIDIQKIKRERTYETLKNELRQAWRDVQGLRDGHYQIVHLIEELDIMLKYLKDLPEDTRQMIRVMRNKLLPRSESKSRVRIVRKPESDRQVDFYA